MPTTCIFKFDHSNMIYYCGETINASIRLETESEKTCREVYIRFIGDAQINWPEPRNRDGKRTDKFIGSETYMDNRVVVHGEGKIPPGTYDYNFRIVLPPHIPSSCLGEYGHIKYQLILVIDRPMRADNLFHQPITVLQHLNLNLKPENLLPVHGEEVKYVCCWPCKSGPIVTTLSIPYGGYAPGQTIKYSIHIDNRSKSFDLNGFELRLVQIFEYTASSPVRKTCINREPLSKSYEMESVLHLNKRVFKGNLLIPPVPPTSTGQSIIKVRYSIEFYVKTGFWHKDSEIAIPITIGTVPLVQTATNPKNLAFMPRTPDTSHSGQPDYSSIKPLSYESFIKVKNHFREEDTKGRMHVDHFLPQYPMYTNFALPTAPLISGLNRAHRNVPDKAVALTKTIQTTNCLNTKM